MPRRLLLPASLLLFAVAGAGPVAAAGWAGTAAAPSLTLRSPIPGLVRIGQTMTVSGRDRRLPARAVIVLEARRERPWSILARTPAGTGGAFRLRWHVGSRTPVGPLSLRVAAVQAGRVLAATRPAQSAVGSRYVPCVPPAPPSALPPGDGWISGGLYIEGGPYPPIDQCQSRAYTVSATAADGSVVSLAHVGAGRSYALVVPAGRYTLRTTGGCPGFGQATVVAGRRTRADAVCAVP